MELWGDEFTRKLCGAWVGEQDANTVRIARVDEGPLAHPDLLAYQLLAIVRAAHDTPIRLMFPMISTLAELTAARGCSTPPSPGRDGATHPGCRSGSWSRYPPPHPRPPRSPHTSTS